VKRIAVLVTVATAFFAGALAPSSSRDSAVARDDGRSPWTIADTVRVGWSTDSESFDTTAYVSAGNGNMDLNP